MRRFKNGQKRHGAKSHALRSRLLYWQKRMHVPRLALQVLLMTGK